MCCSFLLVTYQFIVLLFRVMLLFFPCTVLDRKKQNKDTFAKTKTTLARILLSISDLPSLTLI